MPIREYRCPKCGGIVESLSMYEEGAPCCVSCSQIMKPIPSVPSIIIAGNSGPKLKNRVALDDELKMNGFSSPLYRSEETKDIARWALKKEGLL